MCLLMSFAAFAPDLDLACMTSVAHRVWDVPNPYESSFVAPSDSPLDPEPPPIPEPAGDRRWFVIEDSGDLMGVPLDRNVVAGLQVELVGPAGDPAAAQKTLRVAVDPYHPRFLLWAAGIRVGF